MTRLTSSADAEIRKHRADVTLSIRGADRRPLANQEVVIAQRSRKFLFGGNGHAAISLANGGLELPPTELCTDGRGTVCFSGFLGDYDVTWAGTTRTMSLSRPGAGAADIRI